jgi:tetratricopeptide (TPR) repeat protein
MKKSIFLAALVLIGASCFAQKSNVGKARNLADAETPDYAGARSAIEEALVNDETKDQANTWYVAGYVGYKEYEAEKFKPYTGKQMNVTVAANAILESVKYWDKAYELSQVPTYDKKGKAKYDTRTPKNILPKLKEYFESQILLVASTEVSESDPALAYEYSKVHLSIPEKPVMTDNGEQLVCDTTYYVFMCQAGIYAYEANLYNEAIEVLKLFETEKAKQNAQRSVQIYANQYLYQIYIEQQDTANAVATLMSAINEYPEDAWFMQNLINLYISSGNNAKAIEMLDMAINREPNVGQYHMIKGQLYSVNLKDFPAAFACFQAAIDIEPENADIVYSFGAAYHDYGKDILEKATYIEDKKTYERELLKAGEAFKNALPYCEKAYELKPDNYDFKRALGQIYYRLGMDDKYSALMGE